MSAVELSLLLMFALCLHLEGANANDPAVQLFAALVKGNPHALDLTWTISSEGRLVMEHGMPRYFSISYVWVNRYGCQAVPNTTEYGDRQSVDTIRHSGSQESGQFTLTGLEPNSGYRIYIQAHTPSLTFPESSTYAWTGQKVPVDAPTGLTLIRNESTQTFLKLAWDRVPCTAGSRSSPFLAYHYNLNSDEDPAAGHSLETTAVEASVADLKPYTRYRFRVQFKSERGHGPYSEQLHAVTSGKVSLTQETEVAPGETVELACKGWGSSIFTLPGPDYLILEGPKGKGQRSSTTVSGLVRTNRFRVVVDGPKAEFKCTLHHDGVSEALGTDSLTIKLYEKPHLQTAPAVQMGVPSSDNATVTWLPWVVDGGGDGPVDDQKVVWRRAGDLAYRNMAVRSGSVSAVIGNLERDAKYEFAVVLFRKGIPGPPNKAVFVEAMVEGTTTPVAPNAGKSAGNEHGYHNLFGPETDNLIIAGVCGIFLGVLILLSVFGVWCTSKKIRYDDEVPLAKTAE